MEVLNLNLMIYNHCTFVPIQKTILKKDPNGQPIIFLNYKNQSLFSVFKYLILSKFGLAAPIKNYV